VREELSERQALVREELNERQALVREELNERQARAREELNPEIRWQRRRRTKSLGKMSSDDSTYGQPL